MDEASLELLPQILRMIMALGFVLLLMGALVFILKKLGLAQETKIQSGDKKRLKIVESLPLDARRRIVIIKCDTEEHLVILSANGETVIKQNIPPVDTLPNKAQG